MIVGDFLAFWLLFCDAGAGSGLIGWLFGGIELGDVVVHFLEDFENVEGFGIHLTNIIFNEWIDKIR